MSRSPSYGYEIDDGVDEVYEGEFSDYSSDDDRRRRRRRRRRSNSARKYRKTENSDDGTDRISSLPDSLILHIISFIPIEDAIKTDVLSKRWQFLWTCTPNLDFCHRRRFIGKTDFVSFVDKTLVLCGSSYIKRFRVQFEYRGSYASSIDLWTRFAAKNKVEEIILDLSYGQYEYRDWDFYTLPQQLYANSSLRSLSLTLCQLVPTGLIRWKSLKSLSIGYVVLSEDLIHNILLGSPVLECLELYYFRGIQDLNISSPSVRKLVIREYWSSRARYDDEDHLIAESEDRRFDVLGPNLRCLEITGCLHRKKCRVINVPSLVKANINFVLTNDYNDDSDYEEDGTESTDQEEQQSLIGELLESLKHVHSLALGNWCLQVLLALETKGLPYPPSKRKHLTLDTRISQRDLPVIASLLETSPYLETLVINMDFYSRAEFWSRFSDSVVDYDETAYWTSQKRTFRCLQHLRTLTIVDFKEGNSCTLEFIKFLLQKARVLQRITLHAPKASSSNSCSSRNLFRPAQRLLGFPRSSPQAVIEFSGLK